MFWDNYLQLCIQKDMTPTAVGVELGFSRATVSNWKNGGMPREMALRKLSSYFGVTVDDLLADTPQKTPPASKELTEDDMKLLELFHSIPEDKRAAYLELLAAARKLQ